MKYTKIIMVILIASLSIAMLGSVHTNNTNVINNNNTLSNTTSSQDYEITSYASSGLSHVSITPYNTAYSTVNAEVVVTQSGTILYDNSFIGSTSFTLPLNGGSAKLAIIIDGSTIQNYTLSLSKVTTTTTVQTPELVELGITVFLAGIGYSELRFRLIVNKFSKEEKPKGAYPDDLGKDVSDVTKIAKKKVVNKESYDEIMNFAKIAEEKYGINIKQNVMEEDDKNE